MKNTKRFAYLFPLGGTIQWSGENVDTLTDRLKSRTMFTDEDRYCAEDFIEHCTAGSHMSFSGGEMLFCTKD